jgi:DNA-directed RNA polymerase alpha subunit
VTTNMLHLAAELERLAASLRKVHEQLRNMRGTPLKDIAGFGDLSVRARNAIQSLGVDNLSALCMRTPNEVLCARGAGETTLNEIRSWLKKQGLKLADD